MKVKELIELLQECDHEFEVLIQDDGTGCVTELYLVQSYPEDYDGCVILS